jgi:plastocyanin
MIHRVPTALLLGVPLGVLALAALLAPPASAASPANVVVTFTQATATRSAALNPPAVTVAAGGSVTFDNTKGTANLTISGALAGTKPIMIAMKAKGSIAVAPSTKSTTLTYTATEPATVPVSVAKTAADGKVTVTGVSALGSSAAPAGGGSTGAGGQPTAGGTDNQSSGATGGPFVGPGLPGGVIAPLAPGATAYPNGPAPLVAPFATADPTTNGETTPDGATTSGPAAVAAPSSPRGGTGTRSLGLPAAITAVLLVGVIAALIRVLLTHPAARTIARRH